MRPNAFLLLVAFAAPPVLAQEVVYDATFANALHREAEVVYCVRAGDGTGRALRITGPHPHGWEVHDHDWLGSRVRP